MAGNENADISARMREFEEYLTGGFPHWRWHFLRTDDGDYEAVLFFMDVEYDPVRVTLDLEGFVNIHADGHEWHMLSAVQLYRLAGMVEKAADMIDAWRGGSRNAVYRGWGSYRKFCEDL